MHDQKMYPPRFTLQVCGDKATHDATALVEFEGACEDLSTEIHLSLPTTGSYLRRFHSNIEYYEYLETSAGEVCICDLLSLGATFFSWYKCYNDTIF